MTFEITTSQFHDGNLLHDSTKLIIDDGVVVSIEPYSGPTRVSLVTPGLVDLQMNGYVDVDVSNCSHADFRRLDHELLARGTTSWLATIVTAPLSRLSRSVQNLHEWITLADTGCRGIHIEGPFLGGSPGAHNRDWIIDYNSEWLESLPTTVRLITIAPERPRTAETVHKLRDKGIVISLGHSRALDHEFDAAVSAGATMVTHLFNGMSGVHHRDDGVALSALTDARVAVGLIADGVHVSPRAMQLAFLAKSPLGVCLVSDSIAWDSEWARTSKVAISHGAPRLPDGTLAGSSASLVECVRNVCTLTDISMADAVISATSTPADVMGFPQTGRVTEGHTAELVCYDDDFHVVEVHRRLVSLRGSQTD